MTSTHPSPLALAPAVLLTGGPARYLRADISGGAGDDSIIAGEALWWPPNKLSGRYLALYLSSQIGEAADVMPQGEHAIPVETPLDPIAPTLERGYDELSDRPLGDRREQGASHERH